jgi:hypothetical protein
MRSVNLLERAVNGTVQRVLIVAALCLLAVLSFAPACFAQDDVDGGGTLQSAKVGSSCFVVFVFGADF